MPDERAQLGFDAEESVSRHLAARGFRILDRNWRRPWGELDVVAEREGVIHFIEVKASRRLAAGFAPELRADGRKLAKVRRTARTWLIDHRFGSDTEWQVDVASVVMGSTPEIELFFQE